MSIEREHNDAIQRAMASAGVPERPTDLRDWFAGQALVGLLSGWPSQAELPPVEIATGTAYEYADAMLSAREEG